MDEVAEIAALGALYPGAKGVQVNGRMFVYIPDMAILTTGGVMTVDVLLCPHQMDLGGGYLTRLYVSKQLPNSAKASNWTAHQLLGKQWWAVSWNGVPPTQPWPQILAAHLWAFK